MYYSLQKSQRRCTGYNSAVPPSEVLNSTIDSKLFFVARLSEIRVAPNQASGIFVEDNAKELRWYDTLRLGWARWCACVVIVLMPPRAKRTIEKKAKVLSSSSKVEATAAAAFDAPIVIEVCGFVCSLQSFD